MWSYWIGSAEFQNHGLQHAAGNTQHWPGSEGQGQFQQLFLSFVFTDLISLSHQLLVIVGLSWTFTFTYNIAYLTNICAWRAWVFVWEFKLILHGGYWHLKADVKGSDVPSLRSLLVVEGRMSYSGCPPSGLKICIIYPSWNVLSLYSSSFTAIRSPPSSVWEGHGGMVLKKIRGEGEWRGKPAKRSPGRMASGSGMCLCVYSTWYSHTCYCCDIAITLARYQTFRYYFVNRIEKIFSCCRWPFQIYLHFCAKFVPAALRGLRATHRHTYILRQLFNYGWYLLIKICMLIYY